MAVFGNFKGTTQSDFKIGKTGAKIHGGNSEPSANLAPGDIWIDSSNQSISVYQSNSFVSIGSTLAELNVDDGTLFVDSANDTVSIGSTASNEKLFVNGSLRLGTNPAIKYSGAYLDVSHSNGTETVLRVRDNNTGTDPVFKIYSANNESEVFKVQGNTITVANAYVLPDADGVLGQAIVTDGNGVLSFSEIVASAAGSNTQIQFNDDGALAGSANLVYDVATETLSVSNLSFSQIVLDYGSVLDSNVVIVDYGNVSEQTGFLTPGTYGNTAFSPVITVDSFGNITSITSTQIVAAANISSNTTDDLSEGETNLYFTTARANTAINSKVTTTFVNNLSVDYNSLSNVPDSSNITTNSITLGTGNNVSKMYILRGTTTDDTETELLVDGVSRIPVGANVTLLYDASVVSRRLDAGNESGSWNLKGCADNFNGITSDVGGVYEIIVATDDANLSVDIRADDSNSSVNVYVTGATGKQIRWTALLKTVEVKS
jgi:hypothetical protein